MSLARFALLAALVAASVLVVPSAAAECVTLDEGAGSVHVHAQAEVPTRLHEGPPACVTQVDVSY